VAGGVGDPRAIAHQILGEDRFRPAPLPRPLHGVLDALGGALAPIGDALSDAFSAVAGLVPGGTATAWVLLGGLVVGLAGLATARLTDRSLVDREGRLEAAVRLRFQAGLLRLDELGVLAYRPSLPTAAVARRLGSPVFDGLARRFEELAYGNRRADPGDAGRAREGWERVLTDAGRRG
jgi:hypothetical protein